MTHIYTVDFAAMMRTCHELLGIGAGRATQILLPRVTSYTDVTTPSSILPLAPSTFTQPRKAAASPPSDATY